MRFLKLATAFLIIFPNFIYATTLQVQINGVPKQLTSNIKYDLTLNDAITEDKLNAERIKNLYQIAPEQIQNTLQAHGYYNAHIQQKLQQQTNDNWLATFNIDLGPQTKISSVNVELTGPGKTDPEIRKYLQTPLLQPNSALIHKNYEDTKEELLANLSANGYLQGKFTSSVIEVDRKRNSAKIKLIINSGQRYKFGKIYFIDKVYSPDFLIKYASFKPGDTYNLNKLIELQNNLEGSDLFKDIKIEILNDLDDPNNLVVPIKVILLEKPKNRYSGSIGYGTDTGARAALGWLHRRQSTDGHMIYSNIHVSQRLSLIKANYIIPGAKPATDKYIFGVLGQIDTFEELFSRKWEFHISKIMKRGKLESIYGLWYFTETFRIAHALPYFNKIYLLPTAKWTWLDAHQTPEYEYGTKIDLYLRAGAKFLLSDASVLQAETNIKKIIPTTTYSRLLLRGTLGAVASKEFSTLPPSLRFFTGGNDTVRGFAYNSLGPLAVPSDPDSVTGGRYLVVASVEYEQKIYNKISGVAFFDTGNASQSTNIPLAFGTGLGLRYKTPIGSLRLDLAKPLNTIENRHWRVHANFGMDF